MRRTILAAGLVLMLGSVAADDKKAAPKGETTKPRYVPQRGWQPRPGDTANIQSDDGSPMNIAFSTIDDRQLRYLTGARDRVRIREMIEAGKVIEVPNHTPVVIIDTGEISTTYRTGVVYSSGSNQRMGLIAERDVISWSVRLTDGPHKGRYAIVGDRHLLHFVPVVEKAKPKPKTFRGGTPAALASQAYRDARKLETDGKIPEAIKAYQELSKSIFPEAKLAAARLKVLTGK